MTSSQIRQSFLDFFKSKQHTIVPSSSLMPDSPGLLFTNAGMNQFVPIFLNQKKADVSKWAGAVPGLDTRAADTQKCIRAGGKHNDLEDVGLDTYHHTFFEMLGNWSFGDYFKQEAIEWAWELVVGNWKFPAQRLYATVYKPGPGDPSEFDREAYGHWEKLFKAAGLDPKVHVVSGGKKDNFWMMGDTGPCGPCSELHVDLTPAGDTRGSLVNQGDARCIEIWNLVFIQFNANPDGTFSPLPARHVDTGMGFERVTSIIQGTRGFQDFANAKISNYETDIFRPLFDALEKLGGKKYGGTLPSGSGSGAGVPPATRPSAVPAEGTATGTVAGTDGRRDACPTTDAEQIALDIAFRVIADHIRTLSFAIADGIQPGNTDRNYVLRRILRRAVRYGRTLGFHEPFFYKLVDVLADTMGDVFPEIRARKKHVQEVIRTEEEAFNKTLDRGIKLFENEVFANAITLAANKEGIVSPWFSRDYGYLGLNAELPKELELDVMAFTTLDGKELGKATLTDLRAGAWSKFFKGQPCVLGKDAFELYDTYGFPLDLTELMARERGLTVDKEGFEKLMEEQRARARAAQKKEVISLSQIETTAPTKFVGYETLETPAKVLEVVSLKDKTAVILDTSTCYAEMGGQVGDTGELEHGAQLWRITSTQKSGNAWLHFIESGSTRAPRVADRALAVGGKHTRPRVSQSSPSTIASPRTEDAVDEASTAAREGACAPQTNLPLPVPGNLVQLSVDRPRREAIQRHHTVTHLLHWALHEVVSRDATQKGSFVGPDKLTFDFNSAPLTPAQVADIEKLVNERILENAGVSWTEVPYADVKSRKDVMQFFGDKYGDVVRVVQIGGHAAKLDGYSMELCGGTHTRATGEIGLFRIVGENAIAAGARRIEAVAGLEAYRKATDEVALIKSLAGKVNSPIHELDKKIESLLAYQKGLERSLKSAIQRNAAQTASWLLTRVQTVNDIPLITQNFPDADADYLQAVADALKSRFKGVVVLGGTANASVALVASVSSDFTAKIQAGKIIQQIAPLVGGKGGGKPDNARGGGKDASKLEEALGKAKSLLS